MNLLLKKNSEKINWIEMFIYNVLLLKGGGPRSGGRFLKQQKKTSVLRTSPFPAKAGHGKKGDEL